MFVDVIPEDTRSVFSSLSSDFKADNHICFDISSQKLTPGCFAQQLPADEFIPFSRQLINKIRPEVYSKEKEKKFTFNDSFNY